MAYYNPTLADIIASLAGEQTGAQQPQPRSHPSQFFPFDDEEDFYYPSYYRQDPYGFFPPQLGRYQNLNPRAQAPYRREQQAQRQQGDQSQGEQGEGAQAQAPLDFIDLLSQLTGTSLRKPEQQTKPETSSENKTIAESKTEEKTESSASEQASSEKEESASKPEEASTSAQEQEQAPAPAQAPQKPKAVLRRHSSIPLAKEPSPKVEISQRNTANPSLPYTPQSNIYSTEDEYLAVMAIPGAALKDLDIDFHPSTNEIVVKGTISDPIETFKKSGDNFDLRISEFRTGSIERRFKFPNLPRINEEEIKAKYANGLLNIKIPKVKDEEGESRPKIRKVTIEEVPDEELIYEEAGGVI